MRLPALSCNAAPGIKPHCRLSPVEASDPLVTDTAAAVLAPHRISTSRNTTSDIAALLEFAMRTQFWEAPPVAVMPSIRIGRECHIRAAEAGSASEMYS